MHYLSADSQNEFIKTCAAKFRQAVLEKRRSAKYYSLIVDATPDSSHKEQTTFVFRYAAFNEEEQEYRVEGSFMAYVDFSKKTGEEIANMIQNFLSDNSIPLDDCRGQGYDNGANMAGKYKGVKAHLLEKKSLAIFSPCACHTLNLVGVDSAQSCDEVKSFFGYVQKLFNLFSRSPARWKILFECTGASLHATSTTRWSARIEAVKPIANNLPGVLKALDQLSDTSLSAEAMEDRSILLNYFKSFKGLILLTFWYKILVPIHTANLLMETSISTIDEAVKQLDVLIEEIKAIRDNWDVIVNEAKFVAESLDID